MGITTKETQTEHEKIMTYIYWSRREDATLDSRYPHILQVAHKNEDLLEVSIMLYATNKNWRFFAKDIILPYFNTDQIIGMIIPSSVLDLDTESIKALAMLERAVEFG